MAITFSGLATGLDTDSIVTQIMQLERAPIDRLTTQKNNATQRLNAFFQFKGKLDALKTAVSDMSLTSQVRGTKGTLSKEGSFTATTNSAALGSYDIAVAQLAQTQKTITSGFSSDTDSILGTGTIEVNSVTITVGEGNNSLRTLAESVNAVADQTGVRATIINDGGSSPYRMVFTGKDANTEFDIVPDLESSPGNSIAFTTTLAKSAQQAVAYIDGIKVVSNSNTITDAISGVTLNLTAVDEMVPNTDPPTLATTRFDVTADTDALKEKITSFVTAYNSVMEFINSGYEEFGGSSLLEDTAEEDKESTTTDKDKLLGAVLRGDATVNGAKRQLQAVLTDSIKSGGTFNILSEIGISTQKDGSLKQNNTKLDKALANNFDDMVALLSGEGEVSGVMKRFNSVLLNMTSLSSGIYATQKKVFQSSEANIDKQIGLMELRMTKREASLRAQFTAMEQLISGLNAQGNFLTQQINNLNQKD
ncbi:flagellar filament capping protein FliD [Desulfopila aestuarii]|uniref:Flagellar hook-associated protein 2 n=1 Tax=Desulfopila aestuarii DSM 18488 TaxID=1121416 RepID=A0A1M7YE54_9BACT|nr:flagellar filament capping protein FliD [Desulfopila aestuarii]SHO50778.1 flagellar hook-associated protein 2 [Desulfopila aestuarii DSM 18488]